MVDRRMREQILSSRPKNIELRGKSPQNTPKGYNENEKVSSSRNR